MAPHAGHASPRTAAHLYLRGTAPTSTRDGHSVAAVAGPSRAAPHLFSASRTTRLLGAGPALDEYRSRSARSLPLASLRQPACAARAWPTARRRALAWARRVAAASGAHVRERRDGRRLQPADGRGVDDLQRGNVRQAATAAAMPKADDGGIA